MTMPRVSVVIPCFNAEATVAAAIESALAQAHPNLEVIVIDDGSTDDSTSVLRGYGSRIRWETGPNRGACAARNRGLALSSGDYVQFLDADDTLNPKKIERMLPVAEASGPSGLAVCDWETTVAKAASPPERRRLAPLAEDEDPFVWALRHPLPTPSPLHPRAFLEAAGGWREALSCAQERDLHVRLTALGATLHPVPEALYTVVRRPGSVSGSYLKVLRQHEDIFANAAALLMSLDRSTPSRRRALAAAFARDARHLARRGAFEDAARFFAQAKALDGAAAVDAFGARAARSLARAVGPLTAERILMALGVTRRAAETDAAP